MPEQPYWQLRADGQVIRVKPDHPLLVRGEGWVEVSHLLPGDTLLTPDGRVMPVEEVIPPPGWAVSPSE